MNRYLKSLPIFALIHGLVVDPTWVTADCLLNSPLKTHGVVGSDFQSQAIVPAIRRAPSLLRQSGIQEARTETAVARGAKMARPRIASKWREAWESFEMAWGPQMAEGPHLGVVPQVRQRYSIPQVHQMKNSSDGGRAPGGRSDDAPDNRRHTPAEPRAHFWSLLENLFYGSPAQHFSGQFSHYTLLKPLGQGALGSVYQGRDAAGRSVAIKIARLKDFSEYSDKNPFLRREISNLLQLKSAQTGLIGKPYAGYVDHGLDSQGNPFLVIDYVEGDMLFYTAGGVSADDAIATLLRILPSVGAIHAQNWVHNDLKPTNIMIDRKHREKPATIVDFGSAMPAGHETDKQYVAISPRFGAPELTTGDAIATPASDIYSLGMILATMIYDWPEDVGPPAQNPRPGEIPDSLWAVVVKATQSRDANRYASVEDMERALKAVPHTPESRRGRSPTLMLPDTRGRFAAIHQLDNRYDRWTSWPQQTRRSLGWFAAKHEIWTFLRHLVDPKGFIDLHPPDNEALWEFNVSIRATSLGLNFGETGEFIRRLLDHPEDSQRLIDQEVERRMWLDSPELKTFIRAQIAADLIAVRASIRADRQMRWAGVGLMYALMSLGLVTGAFGSHWILHHFLEPSLNFGYIRQLFPTFAGTAGVLAGNWLGHGLYNTVAVRWNLPLLTLRSSQTSLPSRRWVMQAA